MPTPSPFLHPIIQVVLHLTSPVTSNLLTFFSFKVSECSKHYENIKKSTSSSSVIDFGCYNNELWTNSQMGLPSQTGESHWKNSTQDVGGQDAP